MCVEITVSEKTIDISKDSWLFTERSSMVGTREDSTYLKGYKASWRSNQLELEGTSLV